MLVNNILVANLVVAISIMLQGLIPVIYVIEHGGFWMFITSVVFLGLAVISFVAFVVIRRSACVATINPMRFGLYHLPMAVLLLCALIFFMVYAFVADVSSKNGAIQNMIFLLACGVGFLLLTSVMVILLSFRTTYDYSSSSSRRLQDE